MEGKIDLKDKKILASMFLAITVLVVLIIGATYAYYAMYTSNIVNTTSGTATIGNSEGGLVLFDGTAGELTLDITTEDMIRREDDISYYASYEGTTLDETEEYIGIASAGLENDTNTYSCNYTLAVSHDGENDLYTLFSSDDYENKSEGQLILIVDGVEYDLYEGWPSTVSGSFTVDIDNPAPITAGLMFVNLADVDQGFLADADIEIEFTMPQNGLSCTIVD